MIDSIEEIIVHYFHYEDVKTESVPFGLTNTTVFITVNDQKFVIRKYDRYTKSIQSLHLEMNITSFLEGLQLPFEIPRFLPTLNGEKFVKLQDGTLGACVTYIQGSVPELLTPKDAKTIGRVVGELSNKLNMYKQPDNLNFSGIPFTDMYTIHPLVNQESVESFWNNPPFQITDEQKNGYHLAVASVKNQLESLKLLPKQYVHHDLLLYNLLATGENITGVLDFDFMGYDIAFLEFVISFNHVLQESKGSLLMAAAFIDGYTEYCSFSKDELRQLITLTRLYHVAVLHIYIGQYLAGKDIRLAFTYIINQLIERDCWLNLNLDKLEQKFQKNIRA
ncbi:phosphotransferase [Paenibacillus pasadenensis]|uniref:phosphotransferase enzyme family protein n=1 Tax=Paenibacillus pasadenensis TaxID=217090 RepID=UPI00203FB581|nr:phosphotransferase [Paenibacillus pasadenensis]MCM3745875.1 phosphotransferase [Paenibacillus pasadenensis]